MRIQVTAHPARRGNKHTLTAREVNNINLDRYTYFRPILRPLSSITEAEMKDNHEAYKAAASGLGKLAHGSAASTRHWLSLHIDLFGWIEAGLAIDKTKIETK